MTSNVKNFLKRCQDAYYNGMSVISDEEYDRLVKRFPLAEEAIGPKGDIPHLYRMFSLQKIYPGRGDNPPFNPLGQVETDKLDGCAISLLYIDGEFVQALTRGNGILGNDVTSNIKLLNIPKYISQKVPTQITGEVLITKEVENKRNFASGAVNLKEEDSFVDRIGEGGLIFVAYGIQCSEDSVGITGHYLSDMIWLENENFLTVVNVRTFFKWIPTDGKVIRINSNNQFFKEGWTNKFPRGAYAIKEDEEGEVTTLTKVEWQVGASGKVTPVGYFDPVIIDDATIVKATLNNVDYIGVLDLEIGCQVRVIRAGGVIPKIVERVDD
ncbi:NAD-dependent DNA ligase [Yersinia phage phiR2-01]|uniref:DNA ligase (NAD(+)) n=1 Tax=Yersinia phage phiR2-01 TaxID=1206557 RepID=I7K2Q4_9CAUD|nr:NAD-dependent DNA ligase [Yersinia phage phiR2-01]CCI88536.1 DNA ligase, phage-associated [Yersinia phage phiR2-01]